MILPGFRGIWKLEDQHLCQAMEKNINWQHFSFRLYEVHWVNKEKKILQQKQIPLADRLKNITSHTEAIQMTQRSFSFHIKNVSKWISRWKKFLYGHQQWKLALKLRNRQHNHIHTHNKERKKMTYRYSRLSSLCQESIVVSANIKWIQMKNCGFLEYQLVDFLHLSV